MPLGIVAHYADQEEPLVASLAARFGARVRIIDVRRSPAEVYADIAQCESIVSSSLHGLITADALGIPNRWLLLSKRVSGDGFKFRDYFSSIGRQSQPIQLHGDEPLAFIESQMDRPPASVVEVVGKLRETFQSYSTHRLGNRAQEDV